MDNLMEYWLTMDPNGIIYHGYYICIYVIVIQMGLYHDQWEFQDPKMEVLYHIRPYFVEIFPHIAPAEALYMVGTSNLAKLVNTTPRIVYDTE